MPLLRAVNLNKIFKLKQLIIPAVENFNLSIDKTDFFALVGESGSGKSTVAKLFLRLIKPEEGQIIFKGKNIWQLNKEELKSYHNSISIVFQDPYSSLNPRMKIFSIVEEPLKINRNYTKSEREGIVRKTLKTLGIDESMIERYPHQLSGGQRQRVAIARALILEPEILIADEPLSALDISLQASLLNQLIKIRESREMGIFLITHNLNIVRAVSNKVAVMHLGRIVEEANTEDLFKEPLHPYTKVLLESIPGFHRRNRIKMPRISPEDRISWHIKGCRFYSRCSYRMDICKDNIPELKNLGVRKVRCFLY